MWSSGTWKKPWTWPAWRSMVRTRSTPTPSRHLATIRAEIGSRGAGLLVLARVAVPGHHGDDPVGGGALGLRRSSPATPSARRWGSSPGHVGRGRLDDEGVGAADRLLVAAVDLAVGEGLQGRRRPDRPGGCGDVARRAHSRRARRRPSGACRSPGRSPSSAGSARPCSRARPRPRSIPSPSLRRVALDVLLLAREMPSAPGGTSSVITEPAPVYASSPTCTGATKVVSTPV